MKVLYDHQAFTMQYFGGVSKCFCELIGQFPQSVDYQISIVESNNVHLKASGLCSTLLPVSLDKHTYLQKVKFKGRGKLWDFVAKFPFFNSTEKINKKYSIEMLKAGGFDVFHPTFYDPYFIPYLGNKPYVLTVHDMISELYPELEMKMDVRNKREVAKRASAIIAVSENTKRDLCSILNIPEEKVHVIYHGGPDVIYQNNPPIVDSKYILYMGNRDPYKLFDRLLKEFSKFNKQHPDVKLVCTGKPFSEEELIWLKQLSVINDVIYIRASDSDLANLYTNAFAFVYPSEYEGFGMPILESFAYGCPVLLNNASCFPEVAGDAAMYFDAGHEGSIHNVLDQLYAFTNIQRETLINKGYERLAKYSWKESAKQLLSVYESVC